MPELPEVETIVCDLRAASLVGAFIHDCCFFWPKTAAGLEPVPFAAALRGRTVAAVSRRAKYIVLSLDDGRALLIHLRMTGKLRLERTPAARLPHDRAQLDLADGRALVFNDPRKFGRFQLADTVATALAGIGPEPLGDAFTADALAAMLRGRRRAVKPALLDQSLVAGIGNIYADESLFAARIHPERPAASLTRREIRRLHGAIRAVLVQAIRANGTTLGSAATNFYSVAGRRGRNADNLRVFRRHGQPCPRCGAVIRRCVVGGRGTHFCPHCQPLVLPRSRNRVETT
jgi:formamidopyrimidine-DNA glycosylase